MSAVGSSRPAGSDEPGQAAEAEAIARVLEGDAEAFAPIVRRYLRPAYAIGFRLLGNRHDADDLVQEAFLAALANLSSFDPARPFGPWFYRIVWTRGLNLRKSRARRAGEPLDPERRASSTDPAAELDRSALAEWWEVAAHWLPAAVAAGLAVALLSGAVILATARITPDAEPAPETAAVAQVLANYPDDSVLATLLAGGRTDGLAAWSEP